MIPRLDVIPGELVERRQWVTWKYVNGTKVPFSASTGKPASSTDPATWSTFEESCRAAERRHHAGVGFVFSPEDPFTGIDLDDCIDEAGQLSPAAAAIVATMQTYTEVSPSGTGVKMWVIGDIPSSAKTKGIEIYSWSRFFTLTGQQLPGTPSSIRRVNGDLTALYDSIKPEPAPAAAQAAALPRAADDADHMRRWCLAALEGEQAKMNAAGDGERHNRRYDSAHALGGLLQSGGLTEDEIVDALAVNFGADQRSAMKTIADGIKAGREHPRTIPEPEQEHPEFDVDGHACCPTHHQRLITCRNGNGWRCPAPKIGEPLCFWWQGEGHTPPAELTADDLAELESLDPAELLRRYRVVVAERDRWRSQAEHLDQWRIWTREVAKLPTERLSPAAKVVAFSLYPEMKSRDERGLDEPREVYIGDPKNPKDDGAARNAGLSAGTFGARLQELADAGAIVKIEDRRANGNRKILVQKTAAFTRPDTWGPEQPRGHGGVRPGAGRPIAEECPTCPPETPIEERTVTTTSYHCSTCKTPLHISEPKVSRRRWRPNIQDDCWEVEPSTKNAPIVDATPQLAPTKEDSRPSPIGQVAWWSAEAPEAPNIQDDWSPPPRGTVGIPLLDLDNLPGVSNGCMAPDDPWIQYQRQLQILAAERAAPS